MKLRGLWIWILLLAGLVGFLYWENIGSQLEQKPFNQLVQDIEKANVAKIEEQGRTLIVQSTDGQRYITTGELNKDLRIQLSHNRATVVNAPKTSWLWTALIVAVPILILLFALIYFLQKQGSSGLNILSLRKSRAKILEDTHKARFEDVGGCIEAKEMLGDVVDFLRNPKRWLDAGVRLPRGILLEGAPGCGKTLLARAVAGETDAKFYTVSASEFVEMFVGVGAARVRDMFETAAKDAPSVIFIDELDAVGRRRGSGIGSGHDEREQTLNQLLVCLDGVEALERVVVIGATNRTDILDKALLRPGRFDRRIPMPELTRNDRIEVLRIHTRGKPLGQDVLLEQIADMTVGFNGSQLENLANEAALLAVRRSRKSNDEKPVIGKTDFLAALQPTKDQETIFNKLDEVLVESATQLAEPTGKAFVRLNLLENTTVEGEVLWADGMFIKLLQEGGKEVLVPKSLIKTIEPLAGTDVATREEMRLDQWAIQKPELA